MTELERKRIPAQQYICLTHSGTYSEIGAVHRKLAQWARERKVAVNGLGYTIFHDPPSEIDFSNARYEVCLPFSGQAQPDDEVQIKQLPPATVAFVTHRGSYAQIPARYAEMLAWMDAQGLEPAGPPREVYLKRPARPSADSADCVTEIQFPVDA